MRNNADIFEIFISGILGTLVLIFIGMVVYFASQFFIPFLIAIGVILGGIIVIFTLGWCIENQDNFLNMFRQEQEGTEPDHEEYYLTYTNPVLNGLAKFEYKYGMHTTHFMYLVSQECIPEQMNNLDYLEWVALVNELPSLTNEKETQNEKEQNV